MGKSAAIGALQATLSSQARLPEGRRLSSAKLVFPPGSALPSRCAFCSFDQLCRAGRDVRRSRPR